MRAKGLFSKMLASRQGFTLVELLVALTVFSLGILGVIGMQLMAVRGNAYAWNMSLAQNIAQQKVEYYKNQGYANIRRSDGWLHFGLANSADGGYPAAVSNTVLPAGDRIPTGGDSDGGDDNGNSYYVDMEDYGALRRNHEGGHYQDDGSGNLAAPYDQFRRVTILKYKDGIDSDNITDCLITIKVIVYWKDTTGTERKVSMMTMKGLGS